MSRLGGLGEAKICPLPDCQTPLSPYAIDREPKDIGLRRSLARPVVTTKYVRHSVPCRPVSGDTLSPSLTPWDTKGGPVRTFNAAEQTPQLRAKYG